MAKTKKIIACNSFYNIIADDYNSRLTESDNNVRKVVSLTFKRYVKEGNVLDFGGGTGLDLQWLQDSGYKVFFLEPSVNMRAVAKKNTLNHTAIVFVENNTDFSKWSPEHLPFDGKVEGVLANFAVLNCIKNIDEFFSQVA
ncbi:MAG TPA: methyltransferase domain-containing protein, partial [Flavipsychrobacter sp.]|nr:methyltransferase domain-containing protein [Flavipsychrobacter sp.]